MKVVKSLAVAFLLATMCWGYTVIASARQDDVRREIEAIYAKIDAAIVSEDLKTLESLLAEDYESRRDGKTFTRAEVVAQMKRNFELANAESSKTTVHKIQHVEGNEIVDYTQTVKGTVGSDQSFDITVKGRDWWVKTDEGKWLCVAAERSEQ